MNSLSRHPLLVLSAALIAIAAGCDGLHAPVPGDAAHELGFNLTIPSEAVQAWAAAFEQKDFFAYEALLADEFEFYPRNEDAIDFPWMTGDSWNRAVELEILSNMFDPNFSGYLPPVTQISLTATQESQQTNSQGRPELIHQLVGQVLVGPVDGFGFDTRLKTELVLVGGKYEILRMTELGAYVGVTPPFDESGFGSIKGAYR